jgi:hypothetical protein
MGQRRSRSVTDPRVYSFDELCQIYGTLPVYFGYVPQCFVSTIRCLVLLT